MATSEMVLRDGERESVYLTREEYEEVKRYAMLIRDADNETKEYPRLWQDINGGRLKVMDFLYRHSGFSGGYSCDWLAAALEAHEKGFNNDTISGFMECGGQAQRISQIEHFVNELVLRAFIETKNKISTPEDIERLLVTFKKNFYEDVERARDIRAKHPRLFAVA